MKNLKKNLFSAIIIALFSVAFNSGCNEDDDNIPATCTNGVLDGNETGLDCGGSCSPCTTLSCKATKYIETFTGGSGTHIWKYDSQGRVIMDSVVSNPALSWLINYAGNVVNATLGGAYITVKLNDDGFPIESDAYFQYTATYNSDGTLQSATGIIDSDRVITLDSVVYADGNLISYRQSYSSVYGTISDIYAFTYYTDKDYTTPYNPVAKMYALFGFYPGYPPTASPFDGFTPQPFSKKLLKSMSSPYIRDYSYELDSNGNVTTLTNPFGDTAYEYSCQ